VNVRGGDDAFIVVIPARYGSSRLPGKPLRVLAGRPMIAHVWDRGVESGAREVVVATDDERIRAAVEGFGGRAVMTSTECASGTDRLAEVAAREGWPEEAVVVNLQGDEPCMDSASIRLVARCLADRPTAGMATVATPIREARDLFDPNVVKVVVDDAGSALYFSRAPIPWVRGGFAANPAETATLPADTLFLQHLGLYAYRVGVLRRIAAAAPRPGERAEALEQLRALAMGIDIQVAIVDKAPGHGVDTEEDLERVERRLSEGRGRVNSERRGD